MLKKMHGKRLHQGKPKRSVPKCLQVTEHEEQCVFVEWFKIQFPKIKIAAIPNGMRTSIRVAVKAKKEGMAKGFPDLFIPAWKLFIEMKREIGGVMSADQKEWKTYLEECGYSHIVAKGALDARLQVITFLDSL